MHPLYTVFQLISSLGYSKLSTTFIFFITKLTSVLTPTDSNKLELVKLRIRTTVRRRFILIITVERTSPGKINGNQERILL